MWLFILALERTTEFNRLSGPFIVEWKFYWKLRLEALRKERGLRQEELADAMDVSRQTISSLEKGRYNPSILLAFRLAHFFGKTIEEIFIYEEGDSL